MLTSEEVSDGLNILGSAFRRRVSAETTVVYHRILHERLDSKQWKAAVREAVEQEEEFPTVAKLLRYGEAVSRFDGIPYCQGVPLSDYLDRARAGE